MIIKLVTSKNFGCADTYVLVPTDPDCTDLPDSANGLWSRRSWEAAIEDLVDARTDGDMVNPMSVPEGFVLVPLYATRDMRRAGNERMDKIKADPTMSLADVACYVWDAMLAARPEVPNGNR